eukprot:Plantae.Rhodophyta-Purpureofilum_apyrenoidigerum.ctg2868.p1 GENE.Plantae.Rhodophyta-Purpureofilum_apyrenoidigerum.ctg2868~~Plantae.Rhodophyta-Purpureofilum_apyrenoidigerum.ctg2868.p1  ORF type:complete len:303 (-),score=58.37 Plantae.Rhodophyta-Purpureofilum_apyrenoidigerum.ctg2868:805-1713(-)
MKTAVKDLNAIRNKFVRGRLIADTKIKRKRERQDARKKRKKEREELGDKAPPKQEPRTLENTREPDVTTVLRDDEEVAEEERTDEFAGVFSGKVKPKVMITTGYGATRVTYGFIRELMAVIPHLTYYKRGNHELKKIVKYAEKAEFTDVIVVREDHKELTSLVHTHLLEGPTAEYRLTSFVPTGRIKHHGRSTSHTPEVILNNFTTRLGHRVGRMLGALFPHEPEFRGRQVVTIHNQRDFVFCRFHRYIFDKDGQKVRLQELGPRFTLKLKSLQRGTFDPERGEYEWMCKKEMKTSKRRFFL